MIRIRQINIKIEEKNIEEKLKTKSAKKLNINKEEIEQIQIVKKSIDARKKNEIEYCYEVDIKLKDNLLEEKILKNSNIENTSNKNSKKTSKSKREMISKNNLRDIIKTPNENYEFKITGTKKINNRPIIVGSGPAGLFCAYMLAKNGYNPLIIERGEEIEKRAKTVEEFWEKGILNPESNVQFGEGGAGTFSDGKLNTLVKDKNNRNKKVLEIFYNMGAPEEILYLNKPHIGTDLLKEVIKNLRNEIIKMGGEIRYNSCLTGLNIENNKIKNIEINNSETIKTDILVLAIGHSARDTFKILNKNNLNMEPKPFAVGVRVQHNQEMINESQYGKYGKILPPAPYKLTYHAKNGRGVYSFCMCPRRICSKCIFTKRKTCNKRNE